jgi:hypothetical protein
LLSIHAPLAVDYNYINYAGVKVPWSAKERSTALENFDTDIKRGLLPGKKKIEKVISEEPHLAKRSWKNVKDFLRNHIEKMKKQ